MKKLIKKIKILILCNLLGVHKYELWYKEATLKFCKWCDKQE